MHRRLYPAAVFAAALLASCATAPLATQTALPFSPATGTSPEMPADAAAPAAAPRNLSVKATPESLGFDSARLKKLDDYMAGVVNSGRVAGMTTLLARHGQISQEDMEATFNMGVGMVAIVAEDAAERALELLAERGVPAWVLGSVIPGSGKVVMTGEYRS